MNILRIGTISLLFTALSAAFSGYILSENDNIPYPDDKQYVIRIAPENIVKFVGASDVGDGSSDDPYEDIEEAIVEAPDDATLIFKAGSVHSFSGVINRPFKLKGYNVVIDR